MVPVSIKIWVGIVGNAIVVQPVVDIEAVVGRGKAAQRPRPACAIPYVVIHVAQSSSRRSTADCLVGQPVKVVIAPGECPAGAIDIVRQIGPVASQGKLIRKVASLRPVRFPRQIRQPIQ